MIRALTTVVVLSLGSIAFAAPECNTQLTLSCQATYQTQDQVTEVLTTSSGLTDENWDEPSLANCATTAYIVPSVLPHTSVRIYASKDLYSDAVVADSTASQIEDKIVNGQIVRSAWYSNSTSASASVGQVLNLGTLHLAKPVVKGQSVITDISVSCVVK